MARNLIGSVSKLPSEFCLDRYLKLVPSNLLSWAYHLNVRYNYYEAIKNGHDLSVELEDLFLFKEAQPEHASFKKCLEFLKDEVKGVEAARNVARSWDGYSEKRWASMAAVTPTSLYDCLSVIGGAKDLVVSDAMKYLYVDGFDNAFSSPKVHLSINLHGNDSYIINELLVVLAKYREIRSIPNPSKKVTATSVRKLQLYRILPYLDLYLWAKNLGKEIKPSVMAVALFPKGEMGERDVREKAHSYALAAIEPQFIFSISEYLNFNIERSDKNELNFNLEVDSPK